MQAEKAKQTGNAQMSEKDLDVVIELYDRATALDPTTPVYFWNRAAAHSSKGDHLAAVGNVEQALAVDPNFVKAYHRLMCVHFCKMSPAYGSEPRIAQPRT